MCLLAYFQLGVCKSAAKYALGANTGGFSDNEQGCRYVMFLLGISENKATRKEFAIYRSNVVVPTGPGFFSLKTFCFAKMTSRVFNIVLEGSFQRSCYEPGSTMLKKRDVIEAKLKV